MRGRFWRPRGVVSLVFVLCLALGSAHQAAAQSADEAQDKASRGTVGVITSSLSGTQPRLAADLAAVLDTDGSLRVVPMLGRGPLQAVTDLLHLRGADAAIVPADILAILRAERPQAGIEKRLAYVARLHTEVLYLMTRRDTGSISQLAGQPVSLGPADSAQALTAGHVFKLLGIPIEPVALDVPVALAKLRSGEIAALAWVAATPAEPFLSLAADGELRFLNVPLTPDLEQVYLPAILSHDDYPGLIPANMLIDTLAVPSLLIVATAERPAAERARRMKAFTVALFSRFGRFLEPGRDPAWAAINLAAVAPGWTRFAAAEEWLRTHIQTPPAASANAQGADLRPALDEFLQFLETKDLRGGIATLSEEERRLLFSEFQQWRDRRVQPPR